MHHPSRREVIRQSAGLGMLAAFAGPRHVLADEVAPLQEAPPGDAPHDRDFVIGAGMTETEADCWELVAKSAGAFFELPELHPMDRQEVASAIHIIQNKLLSRPTYRRYLELAKAAYKHQHAP